jgi:hypothetical protein
MYLTQSLLLFAHSGQDSVVRSIVGLQISLDTTYDHHRSSNKNTKLLLQQQQKALIITAITEACCC